MAIAELTTAPDGPLTQQDQNEISAAHARAKKIRKAAGVAAFNGWATTVFAAISAPFALFSVSGAIVTIGLSVVAYNEFCGRKRLMQFDSSAASLLGWNQLGFLGLIVVYCIWMLIVGFSSEGPFAAEIRAKPELAVAIDNIEQFDQVYLILMVAVYATVMVLSVIFQRLNSLYYFSRRKHIERYVNETPDWVVGLQCLTTAK